MFCLTELLGRNSEVEGSLGIIHFNFCKETSAHLYQEDHFQPHFMLFHFLCHIPHCFWRKMCFSFFPKNWILVYRPYFIQSWRKVQRATKWVENKVTLILSDTPNWENMKKIWKENWPAVKADSFSNLKLTHFSPVLHFMWKPVIWFRQQMKWLVSIWNAILGWNRLIK